MYQPIAAGPNIKTTAAVSSISISPPHLTFFRRVRRSLTNNSARRDFYWRPRLGLRRTRIRRNNLPCILRSAINATIRRVVKLDNRV